MPERTPATSARELARAGMTDQIKRTAREHLAVDGPNLSLRAVARDVGLVSSAVYRYFPSRDDLLTALILDGYVALADAADAADAAVARKDPATRWATLCRAVRDWSVTNPHEYALLYGSPVPGYRAPEETIGEASRPPALAVSIVRAAVAGGLEAPADRLSRPVRADLARIAAVPGFDGVPVTLLARLLSVWAQLFGTISFELFGRLTNGITDYDAYFEVQIHVMARHLGLEP